MSYTELEKVAVYRVIKERRDMRDFTGEPIYPAILRKLM
jgi:nitroreductase